jgi:hypothetical protein
VRLAKKAKKRLSMSWVNTPHIEFTRTVSARTEIPGVLWWSNFIFSAV